MRVRTRRWLVEGEGSAGDGLTTLRLACVDDDAQGPSKGTDTRRDKIILKTKDDLMAIFEKNVGGQYEGT